MKADRLKRYSRVCLPLCLLTATVYGQMDKGRQGIVRISDNPEPGELAAAKSALKNGDIILSTGTDLAKFDSLLDVGLEIPDSGTAEELHLQHKLRLLAVRVAANGSPETYECYTPESVEKKPIGLTSLAKHLSTHGWFVPRQ